MNKAGYKYRVLYICIDPALGGSTSSLYNLIDSLRGIVEPIVLFPEKGVGYDYFVKSHIESYVFPFIQLTSFRSNRLWDVWKHPWMWHYIYKRRKDIKCYKYVKTILAGRNVDIVHSNTSPNDVGVYLSRKLGTKHIWHVREFLDLDFHADVYRGIPSLRKLVNKADARIAISTAIKNHWQMPDRNTWVINNAVRKRDEACFISEKEKNLLFCSYYLTERKGARYAIEAFAKSGMASEGYTLKLIGNCEEKYKESLNETAKKNGVLDSIAFIPCQAEVKPYFATATAFIMASEYEAFGRVTAEAMFFGCPIIARATGGSLDIIKNGETGYLFTTMDECAELIRKVCKEEQSAIIRNAQRFAIENLSQEAYPIKIQEVYDTVTRGKENS